MKRMAKEMNTRKPTTATTVSKVAVSSFSIKVAESGMVGNLTKICVVRGSSGDQFLAYSTLRGRNQDTDLALGIFSHYKSF